MKINMNSSGPGLRGSQGEARSPACVCSGQEQKFPCEVAPLPDSPPHPRFPSGASWGGRRGEGQACSLVSSAACQTQPPSSPAPSQHPSSPRPRQVRGLQTGCPGGRKLGLQLRRGGKRWPGTQCDRTRFQGHRAGTPPGIPAASTVRSLTHTPATTRLPARSLSDCAFRELLGNGP